LELKVLKKVEGTLNKNKNDKKMELKPLKIESF
jgi:hypothetical protein